MRRFLSLSTGRNRPEADGHVAGNKSVPFLRTMQFDRSAEPAVNNRRTQPKGAITPASRRACCQKAS
jgi:hypothetical protein